MDPDPEGDGAGLHPGIGGQHGDDQRGLGGERESVCGDQGCSGTDLQVGYGSGRAAAPHGNDQVEVRN